MELRAPAGVTQASVVMGPGSRLLWTTLRVVRSELVRGGVNSLAQVSNSIFKQPIPDTRCRSRDADSARVLQGHSPRNEGAGNAGRSDRARSLACKTK
jgi:hypothetical protein